MRTPKACFQCRQTKKRCSLIEHGRPCAQCIRKETPCSYSISRSSQNPVDIKAKPERRTAVDSEVILEKHTASELLELYFYYVHDRPHSLFHKSALRKRLADGTLNKALSFAICSFGCRFHHDPDVQARAAELTAEAKRLLNASIENVCLEAVQTALLISSFVASESNATSEALYSGIATRMAMILQLNVESTSRNLIEQEVRRRVWWSLFMNDMWSSARLALPRQIVDTVRHPNLPIDEHTFQHLDLSSPSVSWSPGLWAHMVSLVRLFGPIQDLNQSIAADTVGDTQVEAACLQLGRELASWEDMLPSHVKFNDANLRQHAAKGLGGQFVALHLGHHHYQTLLYFHSLDSYEGRPQSDSYHSLVDYCKKHASACSTLLKAARETPKCEAVYTTVGQMAMVSSAVLLHTLLFGAEHELSAARASLSSNFESLVELRKYWPVSMERTIERLFTFQNACLLSLSSSTHKIDRWMVRFLLEHSLPLEAKPSPFQFGLAEDLPSPHQRLLERGRATNDALVDLLE